MPKVEGESEEKCSSRNLNDDVPVGDLVINESLDGKMSRYDLCWNQLSDPFQIRRVRVNGSVHGHLAVKIIRLGSSGVALDWNCNTLD